MPAFGLKDTLRCHLAANRHLLWSMMILLALAQPTWAQGKDPPWIVVPRDAKNITAALAALPGTGTIIVSSEAKSDPGFVAAGFKNLSILVTPSVPITGSAIFTQCTNVAFFAGTIENDLHIDTCTSVRVGPSGFVPSPPTMLSIRKAAYVSDSSDVSLVGLSFTKGAFGIRISSCFDQPAKILDGWRRGKTPQSVITPNPPPGVRIGGCEFIDLAAGAGTTIPVGVRGSASYVEVWNSKFGPYDGYGIEIFGASLAGISQCTFRQLDTAAIELFNAEGFVRRCSIDGVAGIPGDGIAAVMTPAKGNSPRFLKIGPEVSIKNCAGTGARVGGGTGDLDVDVTQCEYGVVMSSGFSGRLNGRIENSSFGVVAVENFSGEIVGVVRGAKKTGVTISDAKGPVRLGLSDAISMGNYYITNTGETALFITDSQNVTASPEITNKFEGRPGGGIVVTRSDVKFPRARVSHAAKPAGFNATDSSITGTITVSDGAGAGFFLSGSTLKGDYNTFKNLGAGFEITNKSEVTLVGQDIVQDAGGAFVVNGGSKLDLTRCNVHGSTIPLKWRGPIDGAAPPDKFQYGIRASDDAKVMVRDCRITSWARAGISVSDANAELNGCYISLHRGRDKNDYDGDFDAVHVRGKSKLAFTKGGFQVVGGNGFRVGQGGTLEVRDLKGTQAPVMYGIAHRGHWLLVEADGDALVQNGDVVAWNADGIRVVKGGKARILGSTFDNGLFGHGIRVDDGSETTVRNNRFTWIEHKDAFRGIHFPIYAEVGAKIEQSENRAGAKDELVGPRR